MTKNTEAAELRAQVAQLEGIVVAETVTITEARAEIARLVALHGQPAMPADTDPLALLECSIKNPLTPFGKLVRTLRIVANTTLLEMAKLTGYTPAQLSAVEFGREPLTPELICFVHRLFHDKGIPVTLDLLQAAASAERLPARRRIEGESRG